ncbi:MAG: nucleoside-diphosphate sugar epimerase/dehydratase, partial [Lapillicoccus sp.]
MEQSVRRRRITGWVWALVDVLCWGVAVYLAVWLRQDFDVTKTLVAGTAVVAVGMAGLHVIVGALTGPYAAGHRRGSFDEVVDVGRTTLLTTLGGFAVFAFVVKPLPTPRAVPLIAGALALGLMFSLRFLIRTYRLPSQDVPGRRRVIIFGGGEGGHQLITAMLRSPAARLHPVAVLDDDPHKSRMRIEGVRVRGTRTALADVAARTRADTLAIAVPSADAALIRDLRERAVEAGLDVLVLPPMSEILGGRLSTNDLRDVDLDDLLGRRPVSLDTAVISEQIAGEVVLVTGAGGSIGSELCRQIARFGPRRLYLLDRDESGLQATQLSLTGSGLLDTDEIVLADIRDLEAMQEVFHRVRPGIVFHAAALKHLPLLEAYPLEAYKSNVLGTLNVLTAASEAGVATFVNISTDKAADPTCVLGYSKRLTERVTADFALNHPGRYVSVRFGNVLGSRGSVVHAFTAQIDRGGPVTVTHPDVERFFMLIPEACQLVLQAASIGSDGDVLVLDMGTPVKILEVANTLIRMSGR